MATRKWQCDSCDSVYDTKQEALECCPDISEVYQCDECGGIYFNEEDADDCCLEEPKEDEEEED